MDIDRTKNLDEIFSEIRKLAEKDVRVCQLFSILKHEFNNCGMDMYYIENDTLLKFMRDLFSDGNLD